MSAAILPLLCRLLWILVWQYVILRCRSYAALVWCISSITNSERNLYGATWIINLKPISVCVRNTCSVAQTTWNDDAEALNVEPTHAELKLLNTACVYYALQH